MFSNNQFKRVLGSISWKHLVSRRRMRWSLAAHDICFTNVFHSYFFMLGKCIPVIRGKGVYQVTFFFFEKGTLNFICNIFLFISDHLCIDVLVILSSTENKSLMTIFHKTNWSLVEIFRYKLVKLETINGVTYFQCENQ